MRRLLVVGACCVLLLACAVSQATGGEQEVALTVTGRLERVVRIGGESTGWAIKLDSPVKIEGKPMKSIEVNHQTKRFEKLENRRVEATGKLTFWHGVETGYWPVLDVSTIQETKSK